MVSMGEKMVELIETKLTDGSLVYDVKMMADDEDRSVLFSCTTKAAAYKLITELERTISVEII
jgi:hypothetical protein